MALWELVLIAIGLSMDAFAVSVCKGLSVKKLSARHALLCGVWFGGFQALMPLIGYFLGAGFRDYIIAIDHWIAFGLLSLIGINMIRESLSKEEEKVDNSFGFKTMLTMAFATSIDALAVGVSFAFLELEIFSSVLLIGVTTFIFSVAGVKIGNVFGARFKNKAEFAGGCILILIGLKILLESLGVF